MDKIVASNSEGLQQLDLVFSPVNDSIHNRMYTCRITSIEDLVISETVAIRVRGSSCPLCTAWYVSVIFA